MMSDPITRRQLLCRTLEMGGAGLLMPLAAGAYAAPTPAKDGWQIGIYTRPWAAYDYRAAFDAIAEAGFRYVGLMTTKGGLVLSTQTTPEQAGQIAEEAKQRELSIPSAYGGDIPVAQSLEAGVQGVKTLVDRCAAAGVANLMMGGIGDAALNDRYYKAIAEACPYAAEKGIGISLKPHGGLNGTGPQCRKCIEAVGHKSFRLWYDPGNILYYSDGTRDPVEDAATVDGLVVGMSVKDYLPPKNVDVTPGTGRVDFAKVMARLKEGGFTGGPLIIETLAPGDLPALFREAKRARKFVEGVVAGL